MKRITRSDVENAFRQFVKEYDPEFKRGYQLEYIACYGGYSIVSASGDSFDNQRRSVREMYDTLWFCVHAKRDVR